MRTSIEEIPKITFALPPCQTRALHIPHGESTGRDDPSFRYDFLLSLPLKRRRYNDDMLLETYRPALLHFAGGQRKEIREPLDFCVDMKHRVWCTLEEDSHCRWRLPSVGNDTCYRFRPLYSGWSNPNDLGCQLRPAEELVRTCELSHTRWNACIPGSISAAGGKFQTADATHLLHQLYVGGEAWIDQFAYGFPITGPLSREFLAPRWEKSASRLPVLEIFATSASRFRERAAKYGMKNASPLWAEAMEQVEEGWLLGPVPLPHDGKPLLRSSNRYNVSYRFGVLLAAKIRACGDLEHSMANLTCTVETPIRLLSWDNIAQLSAMLEAGGGDWAMFKSYQKADYKQTPDWPR